jgi:hypothetical protein
MKNRILLIVAIALSAISLQTSKTYANGISATVYNSNDNSMTFVEDGITFSIFENGEFDFFINELGNGLGVSYETPGVSISFNSGYDYDPYVQYDTYGAVVQIEGTPIYYDNYGRINRAGSINIRYNLGRLNRIGNLNVFYNSYGRYSHCDGYINNFNRSYVYHPYHNWFVRPYIGFSIVRYNPYRNNYNPYRYTYYRDHRYVYRHSGDRYNIRQTKRNTYNAHSSKRRDRVHNDYRRTASTNSKSVKRGTTRRVAERTDNGTRRNNRIVQDNNTVRRSQGNTQGQTRTSGNTSRRIQNDRATSTRSTEKRATTPTRQRSTETRQATTRSKKPSQVRQNQVPRTTQKSQRTTQTRQATKTVKRSKPTQTRQRKATSVRKSPSRNSSSQRSKSKSKSSRGAARR